MQSDKVPTTRVIGGWDESPYRVYSVEKLEFFPGGKIIFDMRKSKI